MQDTPFAAIDPRGLVHGTAFTEIEAMANAIDNGITNAEFKAARVVPITIEQWHALESGQIESVPV